MTYFNREIEALMPSRSMVFMSRAAEMQKTDPSIINLAGGEPDFDTPFRIREEAKKYLDAGYTHYVSGAGLLELREKIAQKLMEDNQAGYSPDGIILTPGGKFAIYLAVRSLINEGDEVLYLEPGWVSYPSIIQASGGVPVPVRLSFQDSFCFTMEQLERKVTDRTRLMIINYPTNPTGKILTEEQCDILEEFLLRHPQIYLLSDEIYERIVYDGKKTISPASRPSIKDRVILVNGFSKSVAMTGWRTGYLAAEPKIAKVMMKLYQHTITGVCGFIQKACITALDCKEEIEAMRKKYEERREFFIGGLNKIEGVECFVPEGAFYAWVRFSLGDMTSQEACEEILLKAGVVGVPGDAYGCDECCVRFSFASSDEDLKTALERIRIFMEEKR